MLLSLAICWITFSIGNLVLTEGELVEGSGSVAAMEDQVSHSVAAMEDQVDGSVAAVEYQVINAAQVEEIIVDAHDVTGDLGEDRVFDPTTVQGIDVLTNYIPVDDITQCCTKCQTINENATLFVFSKSSSHCACLSPIDGVKPSTMDLGQLGDWMPQPVAGVCALNNAAQVEEIVADAQAVIGDLGEDRVFDPTTVQGIDVLTNYIPVDNITQCCTKCQTINENSTLFVFSKSSSHCACLSTIDGVKPATTDPGQLGDWMPQPVAGMCVINAAQVEEIIADAPLCKDGEGNVITEVEEILLKAQIEQLEKENANLQLKIQVQDKEIENKQNLEEINDKLSQENIENMNENEQLRTEKKIQEMNINQLEKDLQSSQDQLLLIQNKKDKLQTKLTETIRNLQNVTTRATHLKSLLDTEQQLKLNHQEETRLERQMHKITKQELDDLKNLIKVPMNFTRILVAYISELENMKQSVDLETTIRQLREKEKLYMAENVAYQKEIEVLMNASYEENYQKENLITTLTQQGQLGNLKERMINVLRTSLMEMTMTIPNCTTIETQALEAQLDAVIQKEDPMKQVISQCSIFNASATNLLSLHAKLNSQLKEQLATKLNVINHHIEENRELTNTLEKTKQLAAIQSESLKHLAAEMDSLIPNGITRVQRNADGTIESVYLCQCIPDAPKASQLEVSAIEWTCPDDKAIDNGWFSNNHQIENKVSRPCPGSDCSQEQSSWPQCTDTLEKAWSSWEYFDCKELDVVNETILCGNGHRSRSREMRLSFADLWRSEEVLEQCEICSLSFTNHEMTITPPALESALSNTINISKPQLPQCSSSSYTVLNDNWRKIDYIFRKSRGSHCDKNLRKGWYRFQGAAGTQLPTSNAPNGTPRSSQQYCGTAATAYMTGGEHPTPEEGIVSRGVCFEWDGNHCFHSLSSLKVAACYGEGDNIYYVYELTPPTSCNHAYCALDGTQDLSVTSSLSLVGGSRRTEGNLHYLGKPVCDDEWGTNEGKVACREMGFSGLDRIRTKSYYGSVNENMSMDDVVCSGSESRLRDCSYTSSENCGASEGAGVVCTP